MTLIKCKDCGADVSTDVKNCPKCGAKVKKPMGLASKAVLGIFATAASMTAINAAREPHKPPPTPTATKSAASDAEDRKRGLAIARATALANAVKKTAKVPSSLKIDSASWMASGALCIEMQALNALGALMPSIAVIPPGTQPTPIIGSPHEPSAASAWNKHCAGKSGEDLGAIVRMSMD